MLRSYIFKFLKTLSQRCDFIYKLQMTHGLESIGPQQHLAQLRMRAIEYGLPVIRVANTGISAIIDAEGKVVKKLSINKSGYLIHLFLPVNTQQYMENLEI